MYSANPRQKMFLRNATDSDCWSASQNAELLVGLIQGWMQQWVYCRPGAVLVTVLELAQANPNCKSEWCSVPHKGRVPHDAAVDSQGGLRKLTNQGKHHTEQACDKCLRHAGKQATNFPCRYKKASCTPPGKGSLKPPS